MKLIPTSIEDVIIIEPVVFADNRGSFMEIYHEERYKAAGIEADFIQDNLSYSVQRTIRGLHYQLPNPQAKLVQVIYGEVFDIAVDIRRGSPTFGQYASVHLSDQNRRQLFIPKGFAHGFSVHSETAVFMYKCSDFYSPESEKGILWSDPDLGIDWQLENPLLSGKDSQFPRLKDVPTEDFPVYEKRVTANTVTP